MLVRVGEGFWTSARFVRSRWSESKNIVPVFSLWQNWSGMKCQFKLFRMAMALVCSKFPPVIKPNTTADVVYQRWFLFPNQLRESVCLCNFSLYWHTRGKGCNLKWNSSLNTYWLGLELMFSSAVPLLTLGKGPKCFWAPLSRGTQRSAVDQRTENELTLCCPPLSLTLPTVSVEFGRAVWLRFYPPAFPPCPNPSFVAHLGGVLVGLTLGVVVLQNYEQRLQQQTLFWIFFCVYTLFVLCAVFWNVFAYSLLDVRLPPPPWVTCCVEGKDTTSPLLLMLGILDCLARPENCSRWSA